ncbi:MAG: S-adenosyl-methyltransferase MraW [Cyanobacteria bacterium RYN_339]|nr:S-adenosyl-methyltransferase MraW [Cyanobacteria bacterium RYN_339]
MENAPFLHQPVLLEEVLAWLDPRPGQVLLDGTVGGGGHSAALLERIGPDGFLYGLDQDPAALEAATERLSKVSDRFKLIRSNFAKLGTLDLPPLDGILLDIGVSSPQLDQGSRGFSFQQAGPLDMRMDPDAPATAAELLATLSETELARIFYEYGEERHGRRVARAIVQDRKEKPYTDTLTFAEFLKRVIPRDPSGIHSATRVFQALRIAVNDELGVLTRVLPAAIASLKPGGKLAVISFHSLEDRIVKHFFRDAAKGCICPGRQPMCTCGKLPSVEVLTGKPVTASASELDCNPRSRSAKLRVARRLPES